MGEQYSGSVRKGYPFAISVTRLNVNESLRIAAHVSSFVLVIGKSMLRK